MLPDLPCIEHAGLYTLIESGDMMEETATVEFCRTPIGWLGAIREFKVGEVRCAVPEEQGSVVEFAKPLSGKFLRSCGAILTRQMDSGRNR